MKSLYETDFHEWAVQTAERVRSGQVPAEELEHIAEELESLGASEKKELGSRLKVLIQHLLKCALREGRPTASWENTIDDQRYAIELLLKGSPSLRRLLAEYVATAYPAARKRAASEMRVSRDALPELVPFTPEQILDPDFYPNAL
jgi:hypothetical protein